MSTKFEASRNSSNIGERESVSAPNPSVLQEPIDIKLLAAESVIWTEKNVAYIGPFGKVPGKLVITRYRMVFLVGDGKRWKLDVPLGHVSKVEKVGGQSRSAAMRGGDDNYGFNVLCKDYRNYKFACLPTSNRKTICDSLNRYAFPISNKLSLFAFVHAAESPRLMRDGWKIYSAEKEYERLGIPSSRLWQMVDINKDYKFSETYPRVFVIPKATVEKGKVFLKKLGEYRSKQRIPVLSWIDQNTLASISRCSQPMTGFAGKKSVLRMSSECLVF